MLFSSVIFLTLFLPLTLVIYFFAGNRLRNLVLLAASLLFYAWGEAGYVLLMLFSIAVNWLFGLFLEACRATSHPRRLLLLIGILLNLLPLLFFKYWAFIVINSNQLLATIGSSPVHVGEIHLPIGISFFTFQAISYLVDLYRGEAKLQRNPLNLALYISCFPQLIAGPIVRYHDVAKQIVERHVSPEDLRYGVYRFVTGLGKKVLIANQMGMVADAIFSLPPAEVPAGLLWLGALSYTLQIYYDFSGYSDMAIGLGRLFGFRYLENFNYPYSAISIQDFWRRWHISLSNWFRDYLYIPLGGNRLGTARTYGNLLLVFLLCGLWHGASWTFVAWGLYHGMFLVLERGSWGRFLGLLPRFLRYGYTCLVVMIGWIFFRADTIDGALVYIGSLLSFGRPAYLDGPLYTAMTSEYYLALVIGVLFATPLLPRIQQLWGGWLAGGKGGSALAREAVSSVIFLIYIGFVLIYGTSLLMGDSHNPFLYFRF